MSATGFLATGATLYGLVGACSFLLQARRMTRRRGSHDVSLGFLGTISGGYLLWLVYGVAIGDIPLIVVDAVGLACASATTVIALRLRGRPSFRSPGQG